MRLRLIIGALILAALAAGLYFSNKQKSAEAAKPPTPADAPAKILTLAEADVTRISLKKKGSDEPFSKRTARVSGNSRRQNNTWQIRKRLPNS